MTKRHLQAAFAHEGMERQGKICPPDADCPLCHTQPSVEEETPPRAEEAGRTDTGGLDRLSRAEDLAVLLGVERLAVVHGIAPRPLADVEYLNVEEAALVRPLGVDPSQAAPQEFTDTERLDYVLAHIDGAVISGCTSRREIDELMREARDEER